MTLTPAMSKAQDLHPPRTLPKVNAWDNEPDVVAAFNALNRIRASITTDDWPLKVFAFHRLYGLPGGEGPIKQLKAYRRILRKRLLEEEVAETFAADEAGDVVEVVDGLLDTNYVALGWLLELGLTPTEINLAMEEVHASNMTKVDDDGKPVFDEGGKVLKSDNYVKADIAHVLDYEQGE
jgi:predicted HAD superfamily Cof-like phosphohydrolase